MKLNYLANSTWLKAEPKEFFMFSKSKYSFKNLMGTNSSLNEYLWTKFPIAIFLIGKVPEEHCFCLALLHTLLNSDNKVVSRLVEGFWLLKQNVHRQYYCSLFNKYLFIYLGLYVTFNTVQIISWWVVCRQRKPVQRGGGAAFRR